MDDALAILYLLGCTKEADVVGICCNYGNGSVDEVFSCTQKLLEETGYINIPLFKGNDPGCNNCHDASDFITEMAELYSDSLIYLGIGSLGNLCDAYKKDSSVFDKISQIVLMGGITAPLYIHDQPLAELNFSINDEASECVLTKGRNVSVITGNNCLPVSELPQDEFLDGLCRADNTSGMYIAQKCGYRFKDKKLIYGADSSYCWDGVAAAYIIRPDLFEDNFVDCYIDRDTLKTGFLNPVSSSESNCMLNLVKAVDRKELQQEFYSKWLNINIETHKADYSCTGLYLDKLIQPCILIELSKEPCHGFLLLQKLKDDGYIDSSLDPAGFYRNLKRMEKEGYISTIEKDVKSTKSRKVFSITDFGNRVLLNWYDSLLLYQNHISAITDGIESSIMNK